MAAKNLTIDLVLEESGYWTDGSTQQSSNSNKSVTLGNSYKRNLIRILLLYNAPLFIYFFRNI